MEGTVTALLRFVSEVASKNNLNLVKWAKMNKVLYLLGKVNSDIQRHWRWQEQRKRYYLYLKVIPNIIQFLNSLGIRGLIVKTIKPFEYVPDDIDILIINGDSEALETVVQELKRLGYFVRQRGTPEVTVRTYINGMYVDLDIHTKMAAGPYEYIDKYYLWRRRKYLDINGVKVPIPSEPDNLIITATHAIMKEFKILLADILHYLYLDESIVREASDISKSLGLSTALQYLIYLAKRTIMQIIARRALPVFPSKIPVHVVLSSYLENLNVRLVNQGIQPLKEIFLFPSSKGIGHLLKYIGIS